MSWPAVRTAPIVLDRTSVGLLAKAALASTLAAPVIFALVAALGVFVVELASMVDKAWLGEEVVTLSEFFSPVGVLVGAFLFWLAVLAIISFVLVPLAWVAALPLAVLAARAGWAGWLLTVTAGGALAGVTAAVLTLWPDGVLEWHGAQSLFVALGFLYGGAFWVAVHRSSPGLLRSRQPISTP